MTMSLAQPRARQAPQVSACGFIEPQQWCDIAPPDRLDPPCVERAGRLAAVACYFNPLGYRSLRENYVRFVREFALWSVPLYVAEIAFGDEPFVDLPNVEQTHVLRLRATERHLLWQKERLLNLIVERLPAEFDSVAFIDADVTLLNRRWVEQCVETLSRFPLVQLWDRWHFLDATGSLIQTGVSVGHWGCRYLAQQGHPGGAWAARREVFPIYDGHVLGGGDSCLIEAALGVRQSFLLSQLNPEWRESLREYEARMEEAVGGRVSTLSGDMVHHYHGSRSNRQYAERTRLLVAHDFLPERHLWIDDNGLFCWSEAASPELQRCVRDYFTFRREDEA